MNLQILEKGRLAFQKTFIIVGILTLGMAMEAQLPAFPGAEGFGAGATGGRGGTVYEVTNLNDAGPGSLRAAVEAYGKRTVVFRISGTIELQSRLSIKNNDITIAGQTAPGDGICLRNYPLIVDADNVIIRFIRCRLGDVSDTEDDAMGGRNQQIIIIDHCSMSWSVDECASFYDNVNFTLQYCLLSESLYASQHDKGNHGYGGIWGGRGVTFHHNLLAHHTSRNPRWCGSRYSNLPDEELVDHRNNVIYNWGFNSCYGGEAGNHNMVANYYKYGPATNNSVRDRIVNPDDNENGYGTYYVEDNYVYNFPYTTSNNWNGVDGITETIKDQIRLTEPLPAPAITEHTAVEAFEHVMAKVGAVLPKRDVVDTRIIYETVTGTAQYGGEYGDAKGIIDTQGTVGGWPTLQPTAAPADSDHDGMPDEWEDANGLNKNDAFDRNGDMKGEGYTNLEYYLNSLAEAFEYILRPINLSLDTIIDKAVTLSWEDISDNETGFVIERKDGDTWTGIATAAADQTEYMDESITAYGEYYYRIKSVNNDMESFYTDSLLANVLDRTGINRMELGDPRLNVYPNPFSGMTRIKYTLDAPTETELSVLDVTGRTIRSINRETQVPGTYSYPLNGSAFENGVYFIRLIHNGTSTIHKVVVSE
ncbi:MAG: T9SS type A sorting domain-containing protein [Bacteroidales bacterium]|nr:T9SS type A sorting domain-containing protein [Bacteroidales bacterium]